MISNTFYSRFFHFFLLSLLVIICYSNTLQAPWHFDDFGNIVDNKIIKLQSLSWNELKKATYFSLNEESGIYTRPVATLTFALNYLLSGYDTTSYHVVNICLHLITALLVYFVFLQTICLYNTRYIPIDSVSKTVSDPSVALLGSVLWAIHPIHTQAVTYIVQRQTVLAAMFYMIAMYCYIRSRMTKGKITSIFLMVMVIIFYLLGVGTKQNAVLLPLSLLGYEVAFFRSSFIKSFRASKIFQVSSVVGMVILSLILFLKGNEVFDYLVQAYGYRTFTMWERLITEPIILLKYIFLLLTPLSDFLTLETDITPAKSLIDPPYTMVAVLAITCFGLTGLYLLKREPILGFAIFFFFANHLVESTFIGLELYFEHRNYLPSIFFYLTISFFFVKLLSVYKEKKNIFMRSIFVVFGVLILISEGNATYLRNDVWKNDIALMEDSILKSPNNMRPYITVSSMYMKLKMFDKAKEYLKKAEDMYKENPNMYQVNLPSLLYYNAGILYSHDWDKKDIDKAIALLYKSCEIYPADYLPHMNLAALLFEKGEYKEAEKAITNAFSLSNNKFPALYVSYGRILYSNGKIDEAINAFLSGMQIESTDELRLNLVALYMKKGDLKKAKFFLDEMHENSNTPSYLLNYALLNPGSRGDSALEKLVGLLVENGVSYCEWIDKIRENNLLGIIYPDILSIEPMLRAKYIESFERIRKNAKKNIIATEKCTLSPGNLSEVSTTVDSKKAMIKY